jgi:chromosomal replication initiation ATPase DnaA
VQPGEEIWSALRDSLRGNASEAVWAAGLNTLRLVDYHDDQIVIGAPNQIQLLRVQQRYLPFITEQAQLLVGPDVQVSLTSCERGPTGATRSSHDVRFICAGFVQPTRIRCRPVSC